MLLQMVIGPLLSFVLERNPDVRIAIETTNRKVKHRGEFRLVDPSPTTPLRRFRGGREISGNRAKGSSLPVELYWIVVGRPTTPEELTRLPSMSSLSPQGPHVWTVVSPEGCELQIRHDPVLIVGDLLLIRQAAVRGVGLATAASIDVF